MTALRPDNSVRSLRLSAPLLLLLAGCVTTPAEPATDSLDGLGARVLRDYIRPHARALVESTARLHGAVDAYCAQPADAQRRARVERNLADVVGAWAGVELLRFGPLVEQNRLEQFFFWPDPRGVLQRQVRTLLAAADPALLQEGNLQAQSVATQGIPALEYVLHADEAPTRIAQGDASGRYRCEFAAAVSGNLARLAMEIDAGWNTSASLAAEFSRPSPRNDIYRSNTEVATEVLKALSTALHVARDQKLAPALGDDAATARGNLLPLHRAGLTAHYLASGAAALSQFVAAGEFGAALPADSAWVESNLREELQRVREDFEGLSMPVDRAVTDASERDAVLHAALLLANARAIVDEYLAPALGVNLGFNALDGD